MLITAMNSIAGRALLTGTSTMNEPKTMTRQAPASTHNNESACARWLLRIGLALCCLAAFTPAAAQPVSQSIRLPNQEYTESREDIKVKVLGGYVRINRSWVAGRWYLNPAWANLRFIADPMGGVLAVDRAASLYERTAGGTGSTVYAFGTENFIAVDADSNLTRRGCSAILGLVSVD